MNKDETLQFVQDLQELRNDIENCMYFSVLPVDHIRINFSEGIDRAVEAVMAVYCELVLVEIQNRKESDHGN